MRVATESTPGESVAVGVFIKSGSRYETDESNGSVCVCVCVCVRVCIQGGVEYEDDGVDGASVLSPYR
jgi:hypothetical protein